MEDVLVVMEATGLESEEVAFQLLEVRATEMDISADTSAGQWR